VVIGASVWALTIVAGLVLLWNHASAPAAAGQSPQRWPETVRVGRAHDRATLVMAAHPQCPCTRASLEELNALMARVSGRIEAHVLFYKPADAPTSWERTDLWRLAAAIPDVHPIQDTDGVEAARFGALASGHVIVYDADGALLFSGGITGSRGHAGDNAGRTAITALVQGHTSARSRTPVFGCALGNDARTPRPRGPATPSAGGSL
jgi:hypothetical protein